MLTVVMMQQLHFFGIIHIIYYDFFMFPYMHAFMEAHFGICSDVHVLVQHLIFHTCLELPEETTSPSYKAVFATNLIPELTT